MYRSLELSLKDWNDKLQAAIEVHDTYFAQMFWT